MASIYSCKECGTNLNLTTSHLYPPGFYFEAGNKGTLSFAMVDTTKLRFENEDKIRPFFETLNYWGLQRKRMKIKCNSCGRLVGYVYDDGPPQTDSPGIHSCCFLVNVCEAVWLQLELNGNRVGETRKQV